MHIDNAKKIYITRNEREIFENNLRLTIFY